MRKIISVFLSLLMITVMAVDVIAITDTDDTATYLMNTVTNPTVASVGGEWSVLGLSRSDAEISDNYFDKYYINVYNYIKSKDGFLHSRKYTEYSRVVLALTAIGKNPEDVAGYNLISPLLDYEKTISQGINGAIWAIIALDSKSYGTSEIREQYIQKILNCEKENGGWALSEEELTADADITAMAITALSNYKDNQNVNLAIERAINVLSAMQSPDGGYSAYGEETSESAAQVLTAVSTLGISYNDTRFVKNGNTLVDNILTYKQPDGSFAHTNKTSLMATEQCFFALCAAKRLEEDKTPLFDMSDVLENNAEISKNSDVVIPNIKHPKRTFDDITGHKNQLAIEEMAKREIINGMNENTFAPDNAMTRAEFATIMVRALGLPLTAVPIFADISDTSWYAQYVNTAYSYGIVSGISQTEFNPNGTITTEQASAMVERAAKLCGMENNLNDISTRNILAEFCDYTTVSDWAKPSIAFCFANNISDRSQTQIIPHEEVKRCTIAQMLYNMLKGAELI